MKKFLFIFIFFLLLAITSIIVFLSVSGYETDRFNNIIIKEIYKKDQNLKIDLNKIKIKLDLKKFDLFLSTNKPKLTYAGINLAISNIDVYLDFISLIRSKPNVSRVIFSTNKIKIEEFKKLVVRIKPSNLKSFILNNTNSGEISGKLNLSFNKDFLLDNYKINGKVQNINFKINNNEKINNTSFNFIADDKLILINSISANYKDIIIPNGSINVEKKDGYILDGSIGTEIKFNELQIKEIVGKFINLKKQKNKISIDGKLLNEFKIELSQSLELKNYTYKLSGNIQDSVIKLDKPFKNNIIIPKVENINFKKTNINFKYNKENKNSILIEGQFSINKNDKFNKFKIINSFNKKNSKFNLDFDFIDTLKFDFINYKKDNSKKANIKSEFNIHKNKIDIKMINFKEGKSILNISGLRIDAKNRIENFKNVEVKTYVNGVENNNFKVSFGKKIVIQGKTYDSTNLIKNINKNDKNSPFGKLNKLIEINFKSVLTKLSIPISNFNLLGEIKKGKLINISSKSEFPGNNYLDITLKKDKNSSKKRLEIFSDLPRVVLADYNFFNSVKGGKLLFVSNFDEQINLSNLKIENFKVIDAPAFAKLLSLADFGGMIDLLNGEGLSFDIMEIKTSKDKDVLKIDELYAIGSSISILIEGYVENKSGLVSLKGTMVPAKNLNKLISKIPVLGKILVPKEIGEGAFGVSFKIKGLPGDMKTTVNPIKTLTPRFITRALEKRKKNN
jgi:hypothetical protein